MNTKTRTKYLKKILDVLYPPACVNCRKRIPDQEDIVCKNCFNMISINESMMCPKCGSRKTTLSNTCHNTEFILAPACYYHDPIPSIIHHYKYKNIRSAKKLLSAILLTYLINLDIGIKNFQISYIPLHKRKQRIRGFNQSEELAKIISNYFDIPIINALEKIKNNKPQAKMKTHEERINNVKDTIRIREGVNLHRTNLILVDDICTSGSTILEASKKLKESGVKKIIGLVVAKAD